jgi:hypothetical protein
MTALRVKLPHKREQRWKNSVVKPSQLRERRDARKQLRSSRKLDDVTEPGNERTE